MCVCGTLKGRVERRERERERERERNEYMKLQLCDFEIHDHNSNSYSDSVDFCAGSPCANGGGCTNSGQLGFTCNCPGNLPQPRCIGKFVLVCETNGQ